MIKSMPAKSAEPNSVLVSFIVQVCPIPSNSIWYDEFDSTGLDPVAKQKVGVLVIDFTRNFKRLGRYRKN